VTTRLEAEMKTDVSTARVYEVQPRGESARGSVWLMLGFAGAAAAIFFLVLVAVGFVFYLIFAYEAYRYHSG
jgi:hypothetical protein